MVFEQVTLRARLQRLEKMIVVVMDGRYNHGAARLAPGQLRNHLQPTAIAQRQIHQRQIKYGAIALCTFQQGLGFAHAARQRAGQRPESHQNGVFQHRQRVPQVIDQQDVFHEASCASACPALCGSCTSGRRSNTSVRPSASVLVFSCAPYSCRR